MLFRSKATRQKAPDDLHAQVPLVEEFLAALNIPGLRVDGFEADDIIATLVKKCREEKRQCYIISSDKDLLQLVGEGIWQLRPVKASRDNEASSPWNLIGPEQVKAEWGVTPEKILDLLSLAGDSSDNIPGVKGIGEKTAIELMARYGSLDGIYQNLAGITGSKGKKGDLDELPFALIPAAYTEALSQALDCHFDSFPVNSKDIWKAVQAHHEGKQP